MRIQRGYSEDTVRIQQWVQSGYSRGTVRVQQGYSGGIVGTSRGTVATIRGIPLNLRQWNVLQGVSNSVNRAIEKGKHM